MLKINFVLGQRWISDTEASLGLGIVQDIADRRVTLSFPAAAEQRIYAIDSAPVSRVVYKVGDWINSVDGLRLKVIEVVEEQDCLLYRGYDENEQLIILPELELDSFVQFSTPEARLFAGQIDSLRRFNLRVETLTHLREHHLSPVNGLLGARVQLLPHQIYIANEASKRHAPRVLLADEVGLGKTIEAGLILHQQLVSGRATRALIIVPDSLVHQWLVEMLRRFNLHFTIIDEVRCLDLSGPDLPDYGDESASLIKDAQELQENPFESAQLVLCSLSFLTSNKKRQTQAQAAGWDLLLVDEAHHLQWSEQQVSSEYACIEALAKVARGLLLLTATPEQLGLESHFARLHLLDPDRYHDLQIFQQEQLNYKPVNVLVKQLLALLLNNEGAQSAQHQGLFEALAKYVSPQRITQLQVVIEDDLANRQGIVDLIIGDLLDQHGTGRVLFRNTRSTVSGFPERQLNSYRLTQPEFYAELAEDTLLETLIKPEQVLSSAYGDDWLKHDSRVEWLTSWLREQQGNKVLLICAQASTAIILEAHLRLYCGVTTAVFHESMDLVARDRGAAYFADMDEGAQVLVCSEIGSEGRNFQFAHHLVLFDLPLNPDLLEQRIGRLDRIGQTQTVQIHVPYYDCSAQAVLLRWYDEGLNSFHAACAGGQLISDTFYEQMAFALQQPQKQTLVENLIEDTLALRLEVEQRLQQGRDCLLELNSCDKTKATRLIEQIILQERSHELSHYMERVFDQYGVEQESHSSFSIVLQPSDHMRTAHFPCLPDGGVTATFQREFALSREDVQFLSWEHPMVMGAMDMVVSEQFGNTALGTIALGPIKPGTVLLEAVFVMQCVAPASLQLFRYLPCTTIRVLLDRKGTQLGYVLSHDKLNKLIKKLPKGTARELVRHAQPEIALIIKKAEQSVESQEQELINAAMLRMQSEQGEALQRLEALSQVNPNIRQQEINLLKEETQSLETYLLSAELKLDALRVIIGV